VFEGDFFNLNESFDLVLEQTFFCAINPIDRVKYANKMAAIIPAGGKLVGLMFDFPLDQGPPFGGEAKEYTTYFEKEFEILSMRRADNSIKPRAGRELFVIFKRKG
jgi:thiopurine S-methyltransferase